MELKQNIKNAICKLVEDDNLHQNAIALFNTLGYNTAAKQGEDDCFSADDFIERFDLDKRLNEEKAFTKHWFQAHLLFQLTGDEISKQVDLFNVGRFDNQIIESYLFLAIDLEPKDDDKNYSRTDLANITREVNKCFIMPVMILFRVGDKLSLSVINRRLNKSNENRDVLEKVTLIKDIDTQNPNRGHIEILFDLSFEELKRNHKFTNFVQLHQAWMKTLDTNELNKRFYKELSYWYFESLKHVNFPNDIGENDEELKAKNLIRMLTRLIFVWFLKEKDELVPDALFDKKTLDDILDYKDKTGSTYYKAVLQNLFFATLNTEMNSDKNNSRSMNKQPAYGSQYYYRYQRFIKNQDALMALFENIPFLNGGLFECLDKKDDNGKVLRIDCFSDNPKNEERLAVPDFLFFGEEKEIDLSDILDKSAKKAKFRPLFTLLNRYKFTIDENTPLEEEVALDPELLGKVFENLLASYNPETKTTARKQTGSFYTPREIVNYMVDESLKASVARALARDDSRAEARATNLDNLFSYNSETVPDFSDTERRDIIAAIDRIKILDPAVGSGAFPMGILQKLVFVLKRLDPDNSLWKEQQRQKASNAAAEAYFIKDDTERKQRLEEIEDIFAANADDYGRKLFLIENSIYGVDIQPIAVQICKLRFFISLIIEQRIDNQKRNKGIRPLPNLETKFVAANTLIGIEQPKIVQGSIFDTTYDDVKKKKEELRKVREKHFRVRTPETKKKCREQDAEIRKELSDLLASSYTNADTTAQLVAWNPYDQNSSAPFFDTEWMFSFNDGFDVVIGNPPYGVSIKGEYRNAVNKSIGKVPDFEIYLYFNEIAHKFLKDGGVKSYIIPNTFMFNVFAANYRIDLLKKWGIREILDCTDLSIFESAVVKNIITMFAKNKTQNQVGYRNTKGAKDFNEIISSRYSLMESNVLLQNNQNWLLAFRLDNFQLKILLKIKNNSLFLENFVKDISQGLIAYDKYQGQDEYTIKNRIYHYSERTNPNLKKWLYGEDVKKYEISWNGKEYIDYCKGIANPRNPIFFNEPRILIREITNPSVFGCYTDEELYNDPSIINIVGNNEINLLSILALINSKVITYYHFNSSPKATKGSFPKILVKDIREFPIPEKLSDKTTQQPFISLVEKILQGKKDGIDTKEWEDDIDEMVYKLYDLTQPEIDIVEGR